MAANVAPRDPEAERQALAALDAFMEALNAHDWERTAAAFNYPHVRFASGRVTVWETAADYAAAMPGRIGGSFERGWARSGWDEREVVHSGPDKVHLAVRFTRYDPTGRPLATYRSLWIVTLLDGHWGVQARSSFAP
jgi:hypothetical protein